MALFSVPGIFTSIHIGRWIDRRGPRGPILLATAVMISGGIVGYLFDSVVTLCIVSAMIGGGYNTFFVTTNQLVGRYGDASTRVKEIALSTQGLAVGAMLGPVVAGFSIDHYGHQVALLLAFRPLLPAVVIGLNKLGFPPARAPATTSEADNGSLRQLLRAPELRRVYLVSFISQATWNSYLFLVPVFGTQIGLSPSQIGLVLGAFCRKEAALCDD